MTVIKNTFFVALFICAGVLSALSAQAQDVQPAQGDLLPVMSGTTQENGVVATPRFTDYPDLRLTSDKPVVLNLDADASNIIVGNTDHVGVLPDNPRNLVVIPRKPGSTYLQVLGVDGAIIMQRHIIVGVAKPSENYIRVRRSCRGEADCEQYSMYYCPGMCHEMGVAGDKNITAVTQTRGTSITTEVNSQNENLGASIDNTVDQVQ